MLTTQISKTLVGATVLLTMVALQPQQTIAAETLTLSSWLPPTHPVVKKCH